MVNGRFILWKPKLREEAKVSRFLYYLPCPAAVHYPLGIANKQLQFLEHSQETVFTLTYLFPCFLLWFLLPLSSLYYLTSRTTPLKVFIHIFSEVVMAVLTSSPLKWTLYYMKKSKQRWPVHQKTIMIDKVIIAMKCKDPI